LLIFIENLRQSAKQGLHLLLIDSCGLLQLMKPRHQFKLAQLRFAFVNYYTLASSPILTLMFAVAFKLIFRLMLFPGAIRFIIAIRDWFDTLDK